MRGEREAVFGVLLAGGLGRRMGGGDKFLRQVCGRPLLAHVIERASPQVAGLVINANGDPARFAPFGLPVATDVVEGFAGPLAGILTGLQWVRAHVPGCAWLASFATDTPFFPNDLVIRLLEAVHGEDAEIGCAASGGRTHPVFGLWPVALAPTLRRALAIEGVRKIDAWTARYRVATAWFPSEPYDPFFNVNEPADLQEAEALLPLATRSAR
jgi:molybdenum cofactor guanylyltransferase